MSAPLFDLDGLVPPPKKAPATAAEYDLTPQVRGASVAADYDLPPIDLRIAWDLDILLQKEPVPASEYAAWLSDLRTLAAEAARRDAGLYAKLIPLLEAQTADFATVTFGGHFKTGKSTLLNAALGRPVLPAADLPETGAICCLRAGDADAVEVWVGENRRKVPCTLEAIQQEISLIGQEGERRDEVHKVERLDITLSGCGIPPHARWIDSPGINDTEEMNACALRAARLADVLVWVLSSKQPLSEVEMVFLAETIAERGPTGVVFVLNAFLAESTPAAWAAFLARKAPWIQDKVLYHAPDLGFTPEAPPLIAPVSGLGLFGDSENDFGRTELRNLLLGLGSPDVPRIRRARLNRTALGLRALAEEQEARREEERIAVEVRRKARAESKREAERMRLHFEGEAREAVSTFYKQWAANARSGAGSLAATITGPGLERSDRYSRLLNEMLRNVVYMTATALITEIQCLAAAHRQPVPSASDEQTLRRLLAPDAVTVTAADLPLNDLASQTAARVDEKLRSLMLPFGIDAKPALGAQFVATVGGNRETPEKRERDAALTRQNAKEAAEQAILILESRREAVCAQILGNGTKHEDDSDLPATPILSFWDERRETVRRLAHQAERLALSGPAP